MPKIITKQQVQEMENENVKLIDIRSQEEYEKMHISGTINIPTGELPAKLTAFKKQDILVCICNYGKERSQQAADFLLNEGFKNSFYLQGGTYGWHEEKEPLKK